MLGFGPRIDIQLRWQCIYHQPKPWAIRSSISTSHFHSRICLSKVLFTHSLAELYAHLQVNWNTFRWIAVAALNAQLRRASVQYVSVNWRHVQRMLILKYLQFKERQKVGIDTDRLLRGGAYSFALISSICWLFSWHSWKKRARIYFCAYSLSLCAEFQLSTLLLVKWLNEWKKERKLVFLVIIGK